MSVPVGILMDYNKLKERKLCQKMNDQNVGSTSKLQELYDLGIDPFGSKFDRSGLSSDLKEEWDQYSKEELVEKKWIVMSL